MASIMTNATAMTALSTLKKVSGSLDITQNRISTGYKVNGPKDNASYWQVATTMKGDTNTLKALSDNLTLVANALAVATSATTRLVDIAEQVRNDLSLATGASDTTPYVEAIQNKVAVMADIIAGASFNGLNLISGSAVSTFVTGLVRGAGTYTLQTTDLTAQDLDGTVHAAMALYDATDAADAQVELADIDTQIQALTTAAATLGNLEAKIELQKDFLSGMMDEMTKGVGRLIDADLDQESTRLQALQVQQQLAIQALGIANQQPQNLLALFR